MPEVWGDDAGEFKPERWFDEDGKNMPFSPFNKFMKYVVQSPSMIIKH